MNTRSKSGIVKKKHFPNFVALALNGLHVALFSNAPPKGYKSIAKNPHWMAAMHDEMDAQNQNHTWTLVPCPYASNIVGSKWVYRTKFKSDGSVEHFKARLVAQDVKNAFLHGQLNETVYIEQPPGRADTSLFVFARNSSIMYLLVYVDDLILTGNNETMLTSFTMHLNSEFTIKDLGDLCYFLGLEVSYTEDGLFLSQEKYAKDILTRADLLDSKPVATPLATNELFISDEPSFSDPTLYRSLVGALQYLTITRPNLSYVVNQASQFLHALTTAYFRSVKRILRYVKGILAFGLMFRRPHSNSILRYSNADRACCIKIRHSTYGYSIFLGGNLVSWSAKKQPIILRSSCES
ncbi:retrovirus-related pol polyprotein from transposon RE1 [Tanacetum coccineum]